MKFINRAKMSVITAGSTETVQLGNAPAGFQTFEAGGLGNADTIAYLIEDGINWEIGLGSYTSSPASISRSTVYSNSLQTTERINLSGSGVYASVVPVAEYLNSVSEDLGSINSAINQIQLQQLKVSSSAGNQITEDGDGIYVSEPQYASTQW